ncbi:MAG: hypothetical protein Q8922_01430 [Bacteroidota bacterium]|nr:hypothetical protein [Bacteroidota bacterium]MDP4232111.1 hypothetical protein [Bacteroidota bacterium]MDP4241181.1 hypothetical protein [Bacteroidota bacterium]MDP4286573.1 hypothetical protein [Bacteroidota bacterium]
MRTRLRDALGVTIMGFTSWTFFDWIHLGRLLGFTEHPVPWWVNAAVAIGIGVALYLYKSYSDRRESRLIDGAINAMKEQSRQDRNVLAHYQPGRKKDTALAQKQDKFLNGNLPVFLYKDDEVLKNLCADQEDGFKLTDREIRSGAETKGSIGAKLKGIGGNVSRKAEREQTDKLKPVEPPLERKFYEYQELALTNKRFPMGLELLEEIQDTSLRRFEEFVKHSKHYGLTLVEAEVSAKREELHVSAAKSTMDKLEKATGEHFLEGPFELLDLGESFKWVFVHPVSSRVKHAVTIVFTTPKALIEKTYAANMSNGKIVNVRVFGKILSAVSEEKKQYEVALVPFAVY